VAVIIPLITVASGISAGMAVAGGAALTFASGMAIAGGIATGLGLVTNNKKLQRFGSILALAGGIAGAVQNLSAGAASAGDASSAWDAAGSAEGSDAGLMARHAKPVADAAGPAADIASAAGPAQNFSFDEFAGMGGKSAAQPSLMQSATANNLTSVQEPSLLAAARQTPVEQLGLNAMPEVGGINQGIMPGASVAESSVQGVAKGMTKSNLD